MAVTKAANLLGGSRVTTVPEGLGYTLKRRLLGRPMVNEQLGEERLSKPLALGVLSPDGISSSAYGSEEILIELLKGGLGIAAFTLLLPLTGVVLFVLVLVVLSYREVVTVYTKTGGSYVVARENFGPRVAQIAAVALLIDYTVTVAVQTAAGAAAIVSAFPALSHVPGLSTANLLLIISVAAILVMCYGNLRGIREAGRAFALPTYLFSGSVILMILIGLGREAFGHLPVIDPATLHGTYYASQTTSTLVSFALVFTLLRAFANGGSSLTGIEAVSNAVSAFRPPEGRNARQVLVIQGLILAFLVGGIAVAGAHHPRHSVHFRDPDRDLAGGEPDLRRRLRPGAVLLRPGGHRADPVHRRQYQLQRLPVPGQLRGRGRVPAPMADQAGAPAGVLQRHHRADRAGAGPDDRGRGQRQQAGAVLRDRRVHRVLDGRLRDGQVPHQAQGTRLAAAARHQLLGRRAHRAGGA